MIAKKFISLVCLSSFLFTGCASIVGQSSFPVTINSNPTDANIRITDERGMDIFTGKTPTTVTLPAGESYFHAKEYKVTFSKSGYADQQGIIKAEISGWYFGNILFGGLIGILIVDPITGKMWKLPTQYTGNLYDKSATNNNERSLQIVSLDQIPNDMKDKLISLN